MTVQVKVYGLFRSGTNLLKLLVERQFDATVLVNNRGNKHLMSPINWNSSGYVPPPHKSVVCVKDPYAAMLSLHRYAESVQFRHFQCSQDWERFLGERFIVKISHRTKPPALYFTNPINYWNAFYFHFLSFDRDVMIVRYEDVIADPARTVAGVGAFLEARSITAEAPALPARNVSKMGETTRDDPLTETEFDPEWYRSRAYMRSYSRAQLETMRRELDPEVVGRLGYAVDASPEAGAA